jgi:hypothetical protein
MSDVEDLQFFRDSVDSIMAARAMGADVASCNAPPTLDSEYSLSQVFDAVFAVECANDALRFRAGYAGYLAAKGVLNAGPTATHNLGYAQGEGMTLEQIRVWTRAGVVHPYMGDLSGGLPTPAKWLAAGVKVGKELREAAYGPRGPRAR